MVVSESEVVPHGELSYTMQAEDHHQQQHHPQHKPISTAAAADNLPSSSLGRQASIYSLTLDEFQHALCESGKNFGSMNMDEFLTSIWNAEENQRAGSNIAPANGNNYNFATAQISNTVGVSSGGGIAIQPSLPRQGSLTLPAPLCRKTVDEVWSDIHGVQLGNNRSGDNSNNGNNSVQVAENAHRQPTFGEMTLEDFLEKAGVVREHSISPTPVVPPQQQHFGVYQSANNPNTGPGFATQPVTVGDASSYASSSKGSAGCACGSGGGYPQAPPAQPPAASVCCGGRLANGGGGYGPGQPKGVVSPVSLDGIGHGGVDGVGGSYGMDMGGIRRRKRIIDGPVERVVERRQRRMIKNRESAARSRARKQAYTVELEAELNLLKEENAQLKHSLAELERKRKQQDNKMKPQTKAHKARERLRTMRRNTSCPL